MSFLGKMLGTSSSFEAQQTANPDQIAQQYGNMQSGFQQQQALVNALQAQGGLQNQSNVFQQQQQLAQQLQQQTLGQGPNPAQAQLAQNTAANAQQQAALMAGQRGASANSGLIARQAAQQGGAMQQQMTGQAATMQAQQQLAAQQQLQQQQAMLGGLATQQVGQQQQAVGQLGQQGLAGYGATTGAANQTAQINAGVQNANSAATAALLGSLAKGAGDAATAGAGKKMAHGGKVQGKVPGKATHPGDTLANDTVPAMLSPGELVIPRSVVAQGPEAILKFAHEHLEEDND